MSEYKVGEEYLFSNDKITWEEGVLFEFEHWSGLTTYSQYKSKSKTFKYCKEKPQRKLYTQSMYDNGEPIEVGMWFMGLEGGELKCLLPVDTEGDVVATKSNGAYGFYQPVPYPDPDKLVDGNAYEFENNKVTINGLYDEDGYMWYFRTKIKLEHCINIRPMKSR